LTSFCKNPAPPWLSVVSCTSWQANGRVYTGVTGDLVIRVKLHKDKSFSGFTHKYNVTKLVYFEEFDGPKAAIEREKEIKSWLRIKKLELITNVNPDFEDLSVGWYDGSTISGRTAGFLQNDVKSHPVEREGT